METPQRVIVERIGSHHVILKRGSSPIFAPTMVGRDANHFLEGLAILLVGGDVVRDREAEQEDERPRPIGAWEAEGKQRQAIVLRGLRENFVRFEDRLAGS